MRHTLEARQAGRLALFEFIEGSYNSRRRHSALGYVSAAEFERRWWQRRDAVQAAVSTGDGKCNRGLESLRCDFLKPGRHPDTPRADADAGGRAGGAKNRNL